MKFVSMPFYNVRYGTASMVCAVQDELLELLNAGINPYVDEIQLELSGGLSSVPEPSGELSPGAEESGGTACHRPVGYLPRPLHRGTDRGAESGYNPDGGAATPGVRRNIYPSESAQKNTV